MGARRSVQVSVVLASVVGLLTSATGAASAASSWTVTPTPNPGGQVVSDITFAGVSAASATDAWGVGIDQLGAFRLPLAEHWDGTSWNGIPSPNPGTTPTPAT